MPEQPFWESAYQTGDETSTFGTASREIVALHGILPSNARVLDLACGDGRHALYLAKLGYEVTAIDVSEVAIRKVVHLAEEGNVKLRAFVTDMREYRFDGEFDLVIAHGCLHLIHRSEWAQVLNSMKKHTRNNGYNVVAVFTDALPSPADLAPFHVGLFREGELFGHYSDWQLREASSYVKHDEHPGSILHTHPINKIVARRIHL